jgi:hypothetical protein
MYEIYHKDTNKSESKAETRAKAWRIFYEDVNTFADNIAEFKLMMVARGYGSRKI